MWTKSTQQLSIPHKLSCRMVALNSHLTTRGLCYSRQPEIDNLSRQLTKADIAVIDRAANAGDLRSMVAVLMKEAALPKGQSYFP